MHLEDDAELYALGMLRPEERARADEHLATCDVCAQRVARAEAVVAELAILPHVDIASVTTRRSYLPLGAVLALAAALFVGFAFGRGSGPPPVSDALRSTLVHSHFRHVSLSSRTAPAIGAKVLYGNDGAWLWIVLDRRDCRCRVIAYRMGVATSLGEPVPTGATSELYTTTALRVDRIVLESRGDAGILASATLAY